jgi:hypothetical protein
MATLRNCRQNARRAKYPTTRDIQNAFFGRPVKGHEWTRASVYAILTSDLIRGYVLHCIKDDRDRRDHSIRAVDDEGNWVPRRGERASGT